MSYDAERCADDLTEAVRRVPAGMRAEDDPDVQLVLSDAVASGQPHEVLRVLAREASARTGHVEWGIYADELRRTGVAHRGLSSCCRDLMLDDDERVARELWRRHGKRALWWFAHVQHDAARPG